MPKLTTDELDGWLHEFRDHECGDPGESRSVDTGWDSSLVDTALVVARLSASRTEAYLRREIGGSPEWTVMFEPREHEADLAADAVMELAAEVAAIGRLCAFLSKRTAEHLETVRAAEAATGALGT